MLQIRDTSTELQNNRPWVSMLHREFAMQGVIFIISAPSGTGKTTLIHNLMKRVPGGAFSVSHTTRPPRPDEVEGQDYHFVSKNEFRNMREAGDFAEWAQVHEHLYGTAKREITSRAETNAYVLFEIDCQGAASLRKAFPQAVSCFILPPSMQELKKRLRLRGTETPHDLKIRLENARTEIGRAREFDYCLINEDINKTTENLAAVLTTAMSRTDRFTDKILELLKEEV